MTADDAEPDPLFYNRVLGAARRKDLDGILDLVADQALDRLLGRCELGGAVTGPLEGLRDPRRRGMRLYVLPEGVDFCVRDPVARPLLDMYDENDGQGRQDHQENVGRAIVKFITVTVRERVEEIRRTMKTRGREYRNGAVREVLDAESHDMGCAGMDFRAEDVLQAPGQ